MRTPTNVTYIYVESGSREREKKKRSRDLPEFVWVERVPRVNQNLVEDGAPVKVEFLPGR